MNNDSINQVVDSFFDFLWTLQNNVFRERDLMKNFPQYNKVFSEHTKDFSMPRSHMRVIFYLLESDDVPISQIANNLSISKSNMTPIIDRLIEYKLVDRYCDPNDRRVLKVRLTSNAFELVDMFKSSFKDLFHQKISILSDEELVIVNDSVTKLSAIIKKLI